MKAYRQELIDLQRIDRVLLQLKKEAQGIPDRKAEIEREADQAKTAFDAAKDDLSEHQAAIRRLEGEVAAEQEKSDRFKTQQLDAKTNEIYRALSKEIEHVATIVGDLEEKEFELMEGTAGLEAAVADAQTAVDAALAEVSSGIAGLDERYETVKAQFEEMKSKRDPLTAKIPDDVLQRYTRLLAAKDGLALVPIEQGSCGGCHMKLTKQQIHDAHAEKEVICSYCGRMLYDPSV